MTKNENTQTASTNSGMSIATAVRRIDEAKGNRDVLARLSKTVGGAYVAGSEGWSLVAARMTFAAREADVYGDTRSKDSTALMSVTEYGKKFSSTDKGVGTARVAQWHRAGRALSLGATDADVRAYLRKPGAYHAETLDSAFGKGKAGRDVFLSAMGKADAEREAKKAERNASKSEQDSVLDSGEALVSESKGVTTVTVQGSLVSVLLSAVASITVADLVTYADGDPVMLAGVTESVRHFLDTVETAGATVEEQARENVA